VQARQRLRDIQPFVDDDGVKRCRLVLEPRVIRTAWQPRRPFQGWRYLEPGDAPPDRKPGRGEDLRRRSAPSWPRSACAERRPRRAP
jgi:hypothetical protein